MSGRGLVKRIDWLTVTLFLLLIVAGWVNIHSTSMTDPDASLLDFSTLYGKQLVFIILALG
mgnify:CR=1 FL=1